MLSDTIIDKALSYNHKCWALFKTASARDKTDIETVRIDSIFIDSFHRFYFSFSIFKQPTHNDFVKSPEISDTLKSEGC